MAGPACRHCGVLYVHTVSCAARHLHFELLLLPLALLLQALFRKIAAALPGMESAAAAKQEELVNVQLTPATVSLSAPAAQQASSCSC